MIFDSGENDDVLTLKMQGNTYIKDKQYLKAIKRYSTALSKLSISENSSKEDIKNESFMSYNGKNEDYSKDDNNMNIIRLSFNRINSSSLLKNLLFQFFE